LCLRRKYAEKIFGWMTIFTDSAEIRLAVKKFGAAARGGGAAV